MPQDAGILVFVICFALCAFAIPVVLGARKRKLRGLEPRDHLGREVKVYGMRTGFVPNGVISPAEYQVIRAEARAYSTMPRLQKLATSPLYYGGFLVLFCTTFALGLASGLFGGLEAVSSAVSIAAGAFMVYYLNTRIVAKPAEVIAVFLRRGRCPQCASDISEVLPGGDDLVTCPACQASWAVNSGGLGAIDEIPIPELA